MYDDNCPVCEIVREDTVYTIHRGDLNTVVLNPRWSPHPGRCAIIPHDHLGENGVYGLSKLSDETKEEMSYLEKRTVDAQIEFARHIDAELKKREGFPLIDRLVRPSRHPNLDLIPQYDVKQPIVIDEYEFPRYADKIGVVPGDSGIENSEPIIGSFSGNDKSMPLELIREIVDIIWDFW